MSEMQFQNFMKNDQKENLTRTELKLLLKSFCGEKPRHSTEYKLSILDFARFIDQAEIIPEKYYKKYQGIMNFTFKN